MSKRRPIQGPSKELIYFLVHNFEDAVRENQYLKSDLAAALLEISVHIIEFETKRHSLGMVNEGDHVATLDEILDVLEQVGLKANYTKSEFV